MEASHLDRQIIKNVLPGVVQIIALARGYRGNYQSAWTGSGTIIHPQGVILTNCHVANPHAMGMPAPKADALAIALTDRSDEPPALTYIAEIIAASPKLDLAVLRITQDVNGRRASKLNLPWVPIGDSDSLELGDIVSIFGYPGIGGETVTFTSGSVSGFSQQRDITSGRAWIKTDATIAGGNSGGTAVSSEGLLIGIPTQAAAGTGISPVDARPVVDTNRDGRIDDRDTPMAIGGFINGLRPVNLAIALLKEAGIDVAQAPKAAPTTKESKTKAAPSAKSTSPLPSLKKPTKTKRPAAPEPTISNLVFSEKVTKDGRPINPSARLAAGIKQIFAGFNFEGMEDGQTWGQVWALNKQQILKDEGKWADGSRGRKTIALGGQGNLPEGTYHLVITLGQGIAAEGEVFVGRQEADNDTEISGKIINRSTKRGISGALVIALNPGVRTADFIAEQRRDMAYTSVKTDRYGNFTFPKQLPKGQSYGLIVVARGYRDMAIDSALRIGANSPEQAQIYPVPMIKE